MKHIKKFKLSRYLKGFGVLEYLIILSPLADVLVGIGKHNGLGVVAMMGPLHKVALLVFTLGALFAAKKIKGWQALMLILVLAACILHIVHVVLDHGAGNIIDNLNTTIRFWFFLIFAMGSLAIYQHSNSNVSEKLHRVLTILAVGYATLLLVPTMLGINNASYAEWLNKTGSAGLFYEANEIGIICGALGAYMIMYYFLKRPSLPTLLVALLTIAAGLTTGTKAALVYLAVALGYVVISSFTKLRRATMNIIGIIIVVAAVIVAAQGVIANIAGSYDRQVVTNSGSISDIIYNGRDQLLSDSMGQFTHDYSAYDRALGGSSVEYDGSEKKDIEMDFADILFNFGIGGLAVYLLGIIFITLKVLAQRIKNWQGIERVGYMAGILAAALMGHTLSSPSVGIILALFAVMTVTYHQGTKKGQHE